MKHLKHLFTALLLLFSVAVNAHDFEVDGIYYYISANKTVEVTYRGNYSNSYSNEYTDNVVIPESVTYNGNTYSVTSIGYEAFQGCSGLTSVVIPNSVKSIGKSAFYSCSGLTSIEIPNSVTSIGLYAFKGCYGLTSVVIPNSVTSIGDYAFEDCSGLTSIEIPNSVTSIGYAAFRSCSGLTSIEIPNSVTSIGGYAFYGTAWYNNQPGGVVYAGKVLYKYKGTMPENTSIIIEEGTLGIADYAFSDCSGLTSVEIPNSVTSIGYEAFQGCSGLTSIVIPNSVTSIGSSAFSDCNGLIRVEIPNSVTSIGSSAFSDCSGLTSIEIGNSVTSIGVCAFSDCYGLTSVVIPNSVTSIGEWAFEYCSGLTSIEIPNSVTSIGISAFRGCTGLKSVTSLIPADKLFEIPSNTFLYSDIPCLYVPYGAKETYASTSGWSAFTNIVELEPETTEVTITINQYGSATYCSPFALDFSNVEGIKAYSAIGYKPSTQIVTLARVMTTGAGQGVFIKGEPGEYTVPVIDNFDEYTLNMLVGTLEQTTVNATDGTMSNYKFTIADGDEAPMFYPFEDNTTFSAGKAYLQIPTAWLTAAAQKSVSVRFDDGETTGVDGIAGECTEGKYIYDLQGRKINEITESGIYIIDGKRVFVK